MKRKIFRLKASPKKTEEIKKPSPVVIPRKVVRKIPKKAAKKKRDYKPFVIDGLEIWGKWSAMVKGFAHRKGLSIVEMPESHRVDIVMDNEWRISVLAMMNKEFSINSYFNYDVPRHNMNIIKYEHIYFNDLSDVLEFQLNNIKSLNKKEN